MGIARWVCLRCLANYQPVVDNSGQDNIIQCVCPKGFYESAPNATSCSRCVYNTYCPGGDRVENPTTRGSSFVCGDNLITRNTGARSQADCVAPRGYAMTSPTTATPCGPSEYAPHLNRLAKCLRCQSGLQEPPGSNMTASQRESKRAVCKVPPGRYMSQGLVRICPQGFYRENYLPYDAPLAQVCVACNPGITTDGPGAGLASLCNQVLPGYGIAQVYNVTGPQSLPPLPSTQNGTGGLPNATLCGMGFYSSGGYCAACPLGTVTTSLGAQSVEDCMVPPGYKVASGNMTQCASGSFRDGWLMASSPKASSCTPCGDGIASDARELDVNPLAPNGSLVRATSASCYIDAGQGILASGKNTYAARDCPINTYGVSARLYGLTAAPCKPCPRNMITDGATKVNNSDTCINPDGFGYATEGASRCAPGFYAAKGSREPCQQCPPGRTTSDAAPAQRVITDCFVKPGFGVVSSSANSTDAFNIDTSGLNGTQLLALPVLECPIGHYGAGNATGAKCVACPTGSSTEGTGSTSVADCSICIPGFGRATANTTSCTICPPGTYQPGGQVACQSCPNATFYPPVDGVGATWTSVGLTTFSGADGEDSCVPRESQLSPEAGQAFFSSLAAVQSLLSNTNASSLAACLASCPTTSCCMAQYDVANGICGIAALAPVGADAPGYKLLYKLPPSTLGSASSRRNVTRQRARAKMMSSGIYARAAVPDANRAQWLLVGTNLDAEARTFSAAAQATLWRAGSEANCKDLCDVSNVCWGFIYDGSRCLFRGGEDALKTRAFFVLPSSVDLGPYNWQGATALDAAVGSALSLAAAQGLSVTTAQVVDALNVVFAQTGTYDPAAALQRILQQQQQQQQAALSAAVGQLIDMASQQGIVLSQQEAAEVLLSQGGASFDLQAALQVVLQRRQGAWGNAVAKVQDAAPGRGLAVPTWAQAVAALSAASAGPDSYNIDTAVELLAKATAVAADVLSMADKQGVARVTMSQAVAALLALYPGTKDFAADGAFKRIADQRAAAIKVMLSAPDKGVAVSFPLALSAINMTYSDAQGFGVDSALEVLVKVRDVAATVGAAAQKEGSGVTVLQVQSLVMGMFMDGGAMDIDAATKVVQQLNSAAGDLAAKAKDLGVVLPLDVAVDMLLGAFAYSRQLSVEAVVKGMPALAEAVPKVVEVSTGAGVSASAEQAARALVDVFSQQGSYDVEAAVKQLQLLAAVVDKTKAEAATQGLGVSEEQPLAAVVSLYGAVGYELADVAACVSYLRLLSKQG